MDNPQFLEQLYEKVILPRYADKLDLAGIKWVSHGQVGPDAWAHHFQTANSDKEYVLLYEDFPDGAYFKDGLSHQIINCGNEPNIELRFSDNAPRVANVTGWYTLFVEE